MRGSSKTAGPKSRRAHTIHVAPITRAIRAALAASAIALVATGVAHAGDCGSGAPVQLVRCIAPDSTNTPVVDLTAVADGHVPSSVVAAHATGIAAQVQALDISIINTGTIDESGSGDVIGINADYAGANLSVVNRGTIYAESVDGIADGIFAYGADVAVNNASQGTIDADGYTWAAGIEAQGETVTVNNAGSISASATAYDTANGVYGHAYGIYAAGSGGDGVVVNNRGSIEVSGPYATGIYAYDGGSEGINVTNRGDITATADNGFASGIKAVTNVEGSDINVSNRGSIEATGMNGATGIVALATGTGSSASVNNTGDIYAATTVYYSTAEGIVASADGDASIRNSGTITVGYGDYAYGALALSFAGDADVRNTGDITVNGGLSGYGVLAASQNGYADVSNAGSITVDSSFGTAAGINASSLAGTTVDNSGAITATASKYAFGVLANTSQGDTVVDNSGSISTDGKYSFGVLAQSGDGNASLYNSGTIAATGKYSYGAVVASNYGDAAIFNAEDGSLSGYSGDLLTVGAFANANNDGNASIDNAGSISAVGAGYAQLAYGAVVQVDAGDGLVSNSGDISADNSYGSARGVIVRSSAGGDATVDNDGNIVATATGTGEYVSSDAIGVYVYVPGGTATVNNTGSIVVSSASGLADGVFAAGAVAEVTNSGSISADGYTWGAGIEAQGDDAVSVTNTGDISASATAYVVADPEAGTEGIYGHAYGIYATGGDGGVMVDNQGTITATGPYATGIYAYDSGIGGIQVGNSGDIVATADNGFATGIKAATNVEYSDIAIENAEGGSITATGMNGATGIAAVASGTGSSASVNNVGDIYAASTVYYSTAEGIVASADGDASIRNSGTITVGYGDYAYGALALAFAGDADVQNTGDITVNGGLSGYGVVAATVNGTATVDNLGSVDVAGGYLYAAGILAQGQAGATASNSGTVTVASDVARYGAFGVQATSSQGDASVDNSGLISVTSGEVPTAGAFASGATANVSNSGQIDIAATFVGYGAVAFSQDGDAGVTNDGAITITTASGGAVGVNVQAEAGATATNTGSITLTALTDTFGIIASAESDGVSVDNSGTITVFSDTPFNGNSNGIAVAAMGDALVDNSGAISVAGGKYATGISASSVAGDIQAFNSGSIAVGDAKYATGIEAIAQAGDVLVDNAASGTVSASASNGSALGVAGVSLAGDVQVDNAGTVAAADDLSTAPYSYTVDVIGIYAAGAGDVSVDNSGAISALSTYGLADGIFAAGEAATVTNSGSITADGYTWGAGIEAQGDDMAWVDNSGDISASAIAYAPADPEAGTEAVYGHAYGIYASGGDGGVYVGNRGMIAATGPYATGIHAYDSGIGGIGISNRGDVAATAENGFATGINAVTVAPDSGVEIANRGTIDATGFNGASGISALAGGEGSGIEVTNAGSISATTSPDSKYGNAVGVAASGDGDVFIRNSAAGSIYASGAYAYGVLSLAFAGDSDVVNAGDIVSNSTGSFYAFSYGVVSSSQNGTAAATNTGSISATAGGLISVARGIDATGIDVDVVNRGTIETDGKYSRGINAVASAGDVAVRNQGSIYAGGKYTYGIAGISTDGDVRITNTADGVVDAYSSGAVAVGLLGISTYDDVEIVNAGSIASHGDYAGLSAGVYASSDNNDVSVINRGTIDASTLYGNAFGVLANIGSDDELSIDNRGDILATSVEANAVGIDGSSEGGGDAVLRNRGTIEASSTAGDAVGISGTAGGGGELTLANTANGSITATTVDGDAIGLLGTLTGSDVTVNNAGSIVVSSTNGAAEAIRIVDASPLAPGNATIVNSGSITGAITTASGNDVISNLRGGTWRLTGKGSDFGGGDDSFSNARGATLQLADAGIAFGAGNNRFSNAGTIRVEGASAIDMTDGSAAAAAAALASPKGSAAFSNDGVLDFLDGAADDSLTITGSFGGHGALNLDVSLTGKVNDQLFVQGGVGAGTRQRINVALLDGLPKSSDVGTQLQLVHVSGVDSPSAFVAGDVLGISPRDFLSMGMNLTSQPDATAKADAGGSSYLLAVDTYVSGLNAAGVLASSAALGVDSLMTSSVGSWRDRNYSLAATGNKPMVATIVPWVRGFRDEGGMSPDHLSGNFGQLSNSRLNQDNYGTEMGLEFQGLNGFRFGTVFAKSEGKQYLVDERGLDTIRGNTAGLYGTWVSPTGFYVDASWRSMAFEANIDSIGGRQRSDGNAVSTNLEAGYTWKLGNGLNVEPQLRYTATSIDGLRIGGDQATFEGQEAQWKRGLAGVSLWKSFGSASGWRWIPYSELNLVRTFEGVASYSINNDYFGDVMTEGTSALVKFGLGAQKGRLSWSGGVNWMDGASYDGAFGGQMSLQYSW